jgi:hypothetical protein
MSEEPITVDHQELTPEQQAEVEHQAQLGEYITSVCGQLKQEVAYVEQQVEIAHASVDSTSREELEGLAGHCGVLANQGYAAAGQLTAAGIQDWVYSVKACNEVGYWANSAAGHVQGAANSEYPTEITGLLGNALDDLRNANASISGA